MIRARAAVLTGQQFYDQRVDAICVVAASWFEDYLVLDMLEECDVPIVGWATPGMETGSLCGMQQLGFVLKQLGRPYELLYGAIDSLDAAQQVLAYASAAALRRRLRGAHIGYLGHRVEGMAETTGHELALKKVFGPRILGIDSQDILNWIVKEGLGHHWMATYGDWRVQLSHLANMVGCSLHAQG